TEERDRRRARFIRTLEAAAGCDLPVRDPHVARGRTLDARGPILALVLHLSQLSDEVSDIRDRSVLPTQRERIARGERRGATEPGAYPACSGRTRQHHDCPQETPRRSASRSPQWCSLHPERG